MRALAAGAAGRDMNAAGRANLVCLWSGGSERGRGECVCVGGAAGGARCGVARPLIDMCSARGCGAAANARRWRLQRVLLPAFAPLSAAHRSVRGAARALTWVLRVVGATALDLQGGTRDRIGDRGGRGRHRCRAREVAGQFTRERGAQAGQQRAKIIG